jgi:predicted TIM-barrel fold metal-dependent hydrolase
LKCSAAIISYADLRLGDAVLKVLEAHRDASPSRFQGIRHNVCWDESPKIPASHTRPTKGLLLDSEFRKGLRCVQKMGLLYEVYLYHPQLHELVDLARAFPDQVIILNHFGGPLGVGPYAGMRDDVMALWKQVLKELAACPNVVAKLGGIAMPRNGFAWHERKKPPTSGELAEATAPYYHFTIESFGPDRCMFESNFPVEKVSCSYTVLWNSFKRIASEYSVSEKAAMFKGVAERVYSIGAAE